MEFEADEINLTGYDNMAKAIGSKNPPYAKIGVLGKDANRSGKGATNATIGAAQEYGVPSRNMPSRSFLRMPLTDEFKKKLETSDIFSEDELKEVLKIGSLLPWMKKVAILGVATVKEAFATGGWGKWAPWSPGYTNQTGDILVDTRQLRDSITEQVVDPS